MAKIAAEFTTSRLRLRKPTLDDAPTIYSAYATDQEVTKFLSWRPHQDLTETRQFLANQLMLWDTEQAYSWVILNQENDELIGMIEIRKKRLPSRVRIRTSQVKLGQWLYD